MAIRKIIFEDDERLRKVAREVDDILDQRTQNIVDDLIDTLYDHGGGIGLAANQIGVLRRIFVIDLGDEDGLRVFINPEIIEQKGESIGTEGCLSIPDVQGLVSRPNYLKVRAFNREGEEFILEATGLLAVCICHEYDHLDGILFTDKLVTKEGDFAEER